MRALITGGGGQLASDLAALLGADARSFSHRRLDITDTDALDRAFAEVQPDVIFNCAAYGAYSVQTALSKSPEPRAVRGD